MFTQINNIVSRFIDFFFTSSEISNADVLHHHHQQQHSKEERDKRDEFIHNFVATYAADK